MFNRVKVRTLRCYRYLKVIFKSLAYLPYHIIKGDFYMKTYNIPVEATLQVIGGKWKVVILCHLKKDKKRTCELKQLMSGITQRC